MTWNNLHGYGYATMWRKGELNLSNFQMMINNYFPSTRSLHLEVWQSVPHSYENSPHSAVLQIFLSIFLSVFFFLFWKIITNCHRFGYDNLNSPQLMGKTELNSPFDIVKVMKNNTRLNFLLKRKSNRKRLKCCRKNGRNVLRHSQLSKRKPQWELLTTA